MSSLSFFSVKPRTRVIIDNDFAGDPDDLFQLAHHLLCPSVEVRAIVGSRLRDGDPFDPSGRTAEHAVERVDEVLEVMGLKGSVPVVKGSETAFSAHGKPSLSEAAEAIVSEALRDDTGLPLYVVCGGGLTEVAAALRADSRIADRMTVVWIGGGEYPDLALAPPGAGRREYNFAIDPEAARYVFNESGVPVWQIPRNVYRQATVTLKELEMRVLPCGALGRLLCEAVSGISGPLRAFGTSLGETYVLGDSPLVLLTALQSTCEPDPSSSEYQLRPRPTFDQDGSYGPQSGRGNIRVYTRIDTRLLFEDFFQKLTAYS